MYKHKTALKKYSSWKISFIKHEAFHLFQEYAHFKVD